MDIFAENYDIMVGADYDKITGFINNIIKKFKPNSSLVCDLGCGTGTVALALSKLGYDMIAIDRSEDMLIEARNKAYEQADGNTLFLCQDIVNFELYGTVDVIYSTLDTVNYITDKRDLNTFFKWVRNYLNYDGLFIFDINSEYKFKEILNGKVSVYEFDDVYCVWETERQHGSTKYEHYLTYFKQDQDGSYNRYDNVQLQRYYSPAEIDQLAKKYDFKILSVKDNYSNKCISDTTQRYTYVLKTIK